MTHTNRRNFLRQSLGWGVLAGVLPSSLQWQTASAKTPKPGSRMALGLVTYQWGRDWDLKTLLANCETTGLLGVELRTTHKHGVEPVLNSDQRREIKNRFADCPVTLVGMGSNERFDHTEPDKLQAAIEATKTFIKLSHDTGGSGVKVKPNSFHKNIPHEVTIEQIGKSLNILGAYGAEYGQQIRLEVHGGCAHLPDIKRIMDVADHPNVAVCWNCNKQDLAGDGLHHNFDLVKNRFGDTVHIRELNVGDYPYQQLINRFVQMDYQGWILLEARTKPADRIVAMIEQRQLFQQMVTKAQQSQPDSPPLPK